MAKIKKVEVKEEVDVKVEAPVAPVEWEAPDLIARRLARLNK